ncbi:HECT-domain (ubiquitin-transferase) [Novymonas esmeraldas]|uniref:HECT-domain (Ubiquitin-transferase) n=1 Tax=Novymonas esmeraldas TaxID=1808958 RepID=A0AAW0EPB9_9TRYP
MASPADEEAYASLLEICTELIICEDADGLPLKKPLAVLHGLLHCPHLGGDATVLSVRATRIILEKFASALSSKLRARLTECVSAALARVAQVVGGPSASGSSFTCVHTQHWELQEELLQCMSAAAQGDKAMQAALPPLPEQLRFCTSVMDVSLDMCLQALRMCCVLLRSTQIRSYPDVVSRIRTVLQSRLAALEAMEMNGDWLRLLRHLTEGVVTLRAYAVPRPDTAQAKASPDSKRQRKRDRDSAASVSGAAPSRRTAAARGRNDDEAHVMLRVCEKVCSNARLDRAFRSAVFSCANAMLDDPASLGGVAADTCVSVAVDLARELTRNMRTTLVIGNPFVSRDIADDVGGIGGGSGSGSGGGGGAGAAASMPSGGAEDSEEDEDHGEDLLSNGEGVKWRLPEPEWPLLVLLARLLAARTVPASEHLWWWVGDDDYARRFSREDRARLSAAFFAAQDVVDLKSRSSRVHLSTMREYQWPFAPGSRLLFQAAPCGYSAAGAQSPSFTPSFHCPPSRAGELALALRSHDVGAFLEHLGAAGSLYDRGVAAYGRSVLLHALLVVGPHAEEATRTALRSVLVDATAEQVAPMAEALVQQDRAWASALLEAGVTETMLRSGGAAARPERSPVVQMLRREAASLPTTPPLLPRSTMTTTEPAELRRVLQRGGRGEVQDLLESLEFAGARTPDTDACVHVVRELAAEQRGDAAVSGWARQLEQLLISLVSKRLQAMLGQLQQSRSLRQMVEEAAVVELVVCDVGRSNQLTCPRRHTLHHHNGISWTCDACNARGQHSGWACRECDYDLCAACARGRCNRVGGAVTATALDVLAMWRAAADAPAGVALFTEEGGLVSNATPLACLHGRTLHLGEVYTTCPCGLVSPGSAVASPPPPCLSGVAGAGVSVLGALLSGFGRGCGEDMGVQRSLLKAYENAGAFVFLGGARAVPPELWSLTMHLGPHLPLTLKHLITRYVAVDCRRYAFQTLHDEAATVLSAVTGVTADSTRSLKTEVPRHDKPGLLRVLHDVFTGLVSPLAKMDFTFVGEEGFGSGPSQEVYTELSAHIRAEPQLWFVTEDDGGADAVTLPFPTATALFLREFFTVGAACARAFVDGYRMDIDLLPQAWPLLLLPSVGLPLDQSGGTGGSLAPGLPAAAALWGVLEALDPSLHRSFAQLRRVSEEELAAMALEMEDGTPITTRAALEQHVLATVVGRYEVALENLRHFQWGLLSVMEVDSLWCLSDEERSSLLCGADSRGDGLVFSEEELRAQTTVGNGYSSDSPHVEMLLSIVGSDFTRAQQHDFLEFLTGSPRLPFNGLAGLGRPITVAMKEMEGDKEQTLPSCNTCFLYLKLPPYSTRDVMRRRLLVAVTEGRRNYSLS